MRRLLFDAPRRAGSVRLSKKQAAARQGVACTSERNEQTAKEREYQQAVRWSGAHTIATINNKETRWLRTITNAGERAGVRKVGLCSDTKKAQWNGRRGQEQVGRATIDRGANGRVRAALEKWR